MTNHLLMRKKQKLQFEKPKEDIISQLPDPLIHQILTLLLPNEAVKTRLLSKRWNSLWISIPVLDFGQIQQCQPTPPLSTDDAKGIAEARAKKFMHFLDNFLLNQRDDSTVVKFCFNCHKYIDPSRFTTWLSYMINHNIQQLNLVVFNSDNLFPRSLFISHSLTVFNLEMKYHLKLPTNAISLPSLKIMSLKYVSFVRDVDACHLFSNCPRLQELYLHKCGWVNVNTIKISAPSLEILLVYEQKPHQTFGLHNCQLFDIFAPNLNQFSYQASLPKSFAFCPMPFLYQAIIKPKILNIAVKERSVEIQHRAMSLFKPISTVQVLSMDRYICEILFQDNSIVPHLPKFLNLVHFELDWLAKTLLSTTLLNMLQIMANLKNLLITRAICHYVKDHSSTAESLPQCMLLCLSRIEIRKICGFKFELDMIEFFLKNARVLEDMVVMMATTFSKKESNDGWIELISGCIRKFPVYAPKCRIQIAE